MSAELGGHGPASGGLQADQTRVVMAEEQAAVARARTALGADGGAGGIAVCLSGGGIRSASYCMGVLQALAERGLLARCDYLSAVSGGGYALGWWSALVRRRTARHAVAGRAPDVALREGVLEAQREIASNDDAGPGHPSVIRDPAVRRFVRAHGNYLTVRGGLLSSDTWTAVATLVRNFLFGLFGPGFFGLGVCYGLWLGVTLLLQLSEEVPAALLWAGLGLASLSWGLACLSEKHAAGAQNPATAAARRRAHGPGPAGASGASGDGGLAGSGGAIRRITLAHQALIALAAAVLSAVMVRCIAPVTGRLGMTVDLAWAARLCVRLDGAVAVMLVVAGVIAWRRDRLPDRDAASRCKAIALAAMPFVVLALVAGAFSGFVGGAGLHGGGDWGIGAWLTGSDGGRLKPLQIAALLFALVLVNTWECVRVMWAWTVGDLFYRVPFRGGAEVGGLVASLLAGVLAVRLLHWGDLAAGASALILLPALMALVGAGLITAVTTMVLMARGSIGSSAEREWWSHWNGVLMLTCLMVAVVLLLEGGVNVLPPAWLGDAVLAAGSAALLLFLISLFEARTFLGGLLFRMCGQSAVVCLFVFLSLSARHMHLHAHAGVSGASAAATPSTLWAVPTELLPLSPILTGLFLLSLMVLYFSGANTFSLHEFYRNRLVRAFLGASDPPPEGEDGSADMELRELVVEMGDPPLVVRPFPIWSAAVNLTNQRDLGAQERKAASFTLSPLHGGYDFRADEHGPAAQRENARRTYAPVATFGMRHDEAQTGFEAERLTVGTAIATSGAAFSPTSGATTRPERALLMTLLGLRLGRWFPNPGARAPEAGGPSPWDVGLPQYHQGQVYKRLVRWRGVSDSLILHEAMSNCDVDGAAVYVTDGGHFENLGVYEMIRRQIPVIVAIDADCDPAFRFDDLHNLLAKVRADFGAEIVARDLDRLRLPAAGGYAERCCLVWEIIYERDRQGRPCRTGSLIYCKSTLTGKEPEELLAYRERVPSFPHVSTLNQWFAESAFEAYRTLGLHAGRVVVELLPASIAAVNATPAAGLERC